MLVRLLGLGDQRAWPAVVGHVAVALAVPPAGLHLSRSAGGAWLASDSVGGRPRRRHRPAGQQALAPVHGRRRSMSSRPGAGFRRQRQGPFPALCRRCRRGSRGRAAGYAYSCDRDGAWAFGKPLVLRSGLLRRKHVIRSRRSQTRPAAVVARAMTWSLGGPVAAATPSVISTYVSPL